MMFMALVDMAITAMWQQALHPTAGLGLRFGAPAAIGYAALAASAIFTWRQRRPSLWWCAVPIGLGFALLGYAGTDPNLNYESAQPTLWSFYALTVATASYAVWQAEGARTAASLLCIYALAQGWMFAFIATMAMTNTWI